VLAVPEEGDRRRRAAKDQNMSNNAKLPYFRLGEVVYFLHLGRDAGGPVKVGFTDNFPRRYYELQHKRREMLKVLCVIPGGRVVEQALHATLNPWRLPDDGTNGGSEWFACEHLEAWALRLHQDDDLIEAVTRAASEPRASEAILALLTGENRNQ
jgi:hypothetical protein